MIRDAPIDVRVGLSDTQRRAAAALYDEAFGEKFKAAISSESARLGLLEETFVGRFAVCATVDGTLVGLAGFHTVDGSLTGGIDSNELVSRLGIFRGVRAALVFSLYERGLKPGELLMDGIAVRQAYRGRGIGSRLLAEIVDYAGTHEFSCVRLDVIDTNSGARRLYERSGFTAVKSESFPYLRWLLGFGGVTTMTLEL